MLSKLADTNINIMKNNISIFKGIIEIFSNYNFIIKIDKVFLLINQKGTSSETIYWKFVGLKVLNFILKK
jgi:hypothetical protein